MSAGTYKDSEQPHEATDASLPVIAVTAGAIVAMILASLLIGWTLWKPWPAARRDAADQKFQYGPRDVPDILREWPAIERETRLHLHTYGWIDRRRGIVRIPIDQAMKRMAEAQR